MLAPLLGALGLLTLLASAVGNPGMVPSPGRKPSQAEATATLPAAAELSGPLAFYEKSWRAWISLPDYCWSGNTVNQIQKANCARWWTELAAASAVALSPLAGVLLLWMIAGDLLRSFYRRSRKRVDRGNPILTGRMSRRGVVLPDPFSWFFCLRPVRLELPGGKRMRVHIPLSEPLPLAGQSLCVFELGKVLGRPRYIATLYAPHMAVVHGGRQKF
jgi:hypothetical protein